MKLTFALMHLFLELHLMCGFRDPLYSSVGRVPIHRTVMGIDEDFRGKCEAMFVEDNADFGVWRYISDEEGFKVREGRRYSLVKTKSIRFACPWDIELKDRW